MPFLSAKMTKKLHRLIKPLGNRRLHIRTEDETIDRNSGRGMLAVAMNHEGKTGSGGAAAAIEGIRLSKTSLT